MRAVFQPPLCNGAGQPGGARLLTMARLACRLLLGNFPLSLLRSLLFLALHFGQPGATLYCGSAIDRAASRLRVGLALTGTKSGRGSACSFRGETSGICRLNSPGNALSTGRSGRGQGLRAGGYASQQSNRLASPCVPAMRAMLSYRLLDCHTGCIV
jgi:hypothetical protein